MLPSVVRDRGDGAGPRPGRPSAILPVPTEPEERPLNTACAEALSIAMLALVLVGAVVHPWDWPEAALALPLPPC